MDWKTTNPDQTHKNIVCLCWGLTSQSTIFQSCQDGEKYSALPSKTPIFFSSGTALTCKTFTFETSKEIKIYIWN